MATNTLSANTRMYLASQVNKLFGRMLLALECPLTLVERADLAYCNIEPHHMSAIRQVRYLGVLLPSELVAMRFATVPAGGSIHVNLHSFDSDQPDGLFHGARDGTGRPLSRAYVAQRVGHPLATRFFRWLDQTAAVTAEINRAYQTHQHIMDMATTCGHLHRMVPELYKLAGSPGTASRHASVPYAWHAYDRARVADLTTMMAKCSLLKPQPDGDSTEWLWTKRDQFTWPTLPASL